MDLISRLWRDRLAVLLENLSRGEQEYREIANLSEHIRVDYHGRFLIELLQNAQDQAADLRVDGARVLVIRTSTCVAVFNQGAPFGERGIRAVTSLGVSPKNAQIHIGNKGVGFKAVFEVSPAPEIFSAAGGLHLPPPVALQLDQQVFTREESRGQLTALIEELLQDRALRERLATRLGMADLTGKVLAEVAASAPFKFPRPLAGEVFGGRLKELALSPEDLREVNTAVVLPLREGKPCQQVVDRAVAEMGRSPTGQLLFLPNLGRLEVRDHVRGVDVVFERRQLQREAVGGGAWRAQVEIQRLDGRAPASSACFLVMGRTVGGEGSPHAQDEAARLEAAVAQLPGPGWKAVRAAPVAVALPLPQGDQATPLAPDGQLCIGLPTLDRTGSPFWVDAHFHGTLSRTNIDLIDNPYNNLLFSEAVALVAQLLEGLKASDSLERRRWVTLAMTRGEGCLARQLFTPGGVGRGSVVLAADGLSWLTGEEATVPSEREMPLFLRLSGEVATPEELRAAQLILPDAALVASEEGRTLLRRLGARDIEADAWVRRLGDGRSLIERLAHTHRRAEPTFWAALLDHCLTRLGDRAREHTILPIGEEELASPAQGVFLRPGTELNSSLRMSVEDLIEVEGEVLSALHILDEGVVPVREGGRWLTELGKRLCPEGETPWVFRPDPLTLLTTALAPRLQEAAEQEGPMAWRLLLIGLRWAHAIKGSEARAGLGALLRVPSDRPGSWLPPEQLYLGKGWGEAFADEWLEEAYGSTGRRLLPWADFARRARVPHSERPTWMDLLIEVGVHTSPRLLTVEADGDASAALLALASTRAGDPGVAEELAEDVAAWRRSLPTLRSGGHVQVPCVWIDGLERPEARRAVAAMVFSHAAIYREVLTHKVAGFSHVPSLWCSTWAREQWPVIPVRAGSPLLSGEVAPATHLWQLDPTERRRTSLALLPMPAVDPWRDRAAGEILTQLGVTPLAEAPRANLVEALHSLADALPNLSEEQHAPADALAAELYRRWDGDTRPPEPSAVKMLLARPLPLWRGQRLVSALLTGSEPLYFTDHPYRARFLPELAVSLTMPCAPETPLATLYDRLRRTLGGDAILRVSTLAIDPRFTAATHPLPLLPLLEEKLPGKGVTLHLACLVAYGLPSLRLDINGREFSALWERLESLHLREGVFDEGHRAFYDEPHQLLLVDSKLAREATHLIAELWPAAGTPWRDMLSAYAYALRVGEQEEFVQERGIDSIRRETVRGWLRHTRSAVLRRFKALLLGVWRRTRRDVALAVFERELLELSGVPEVEGWLGLSPPSAADAQGRVEGMATWLEEAVTLPIGKAEVYLLRRMGLSVAEWQRARRELGQEPFIFEESRALALQCQERALAALKIVLAESPGDGAEELAELFVFSLQRPPPPQLLHEPLSPATRKAVLSWITDVLPEDLATQVSARMDRPDADLRYYLERAVGQRIEEAQMSLKAVVAVAAELARQTRRPLDPALLTAAPGVTRVSRGELAHAPLMLRRLEQALTQACPQVAARMGAVGAFDAPRDTGELRCLFLELPPDDDQDDELLLEEVILEERLPERREIQPVTDPRLEQVVRRLRGALPRMGQSYELHHVPRPGRADAPVLCDYIFAEIGAPPGGTLRQPECWIRLKDPPRVAGAPLPVTQAEWDAAQRCRATGGERLYVLARPHHQDDPAAPVDVVVDPVGSWLGGELQLCLLPGGSVA